jgi:hypothetical protein
VFGFGLGWKKATATLVDRVDDMTGTASGTIAPYYRYIAEVQPKNGEPTFRAEVKQPMVSNIGIGSYAIGDVVPVRANPAKKKIRFVHWDPSRPARRFQRQQDAEEQAEVDAKIKGG